MTITPLTLAEIQAVAGGMTDEEALAYYMAGHYDWMSYMGEDQAIRLGIRAGGTSNPSDSTNPYPAAPPYMAPP